MAVWLEDGVVGKLGVARLISRFAFFSGMRYPSPPWFPKLAHGLRVGWRTIVTVVECLTVLILVSNVVLLAKEATTEIAVFAECTGSLLLFVYGMGKSQWLYSKREVLERVMGRLHSVAEELDLNPLHNDNYLPLHKRLVHWIHQYSMGKFLMVVSSSFPMIGLQTVLGIIWPKPDTPFPMLGWAPINRANRLQYGLVGAVQFVGYPLMATRDLYADLSLLLILTAVNAQLVYLRQLLKLIVRSEDASRTQLLRWWIRQHNRVLSMLLELRTIMGPMMLITYASVSALCFLIMMRITEDDSFNWSQQISIIVVVLSNLIHLYIISTVGDTIAYNSMAASDAVMSTALWELPQRQRLAVLQIAVRCTKPHLIRFGDNRILCIHSFGNILTRLFGYFNTVYQLRH